MKRYHLLIFIATFFAITSCNNKTDNTSSTNTIPQTSADGWLGKYDPIDAKDLPDNVIQLIADEWMLVTAGNKDSYNTMTASWGGIGYVWGFPASTIYIRDTRYTYQFLQREESFTLSFFTEKHRGALRICGTKSGRDSDKVKEAGLTPIETPSGLMAFDEARMIIECKKAFVQELDFENFTDAYKEKIMNENYNNEHSASKHQMFISEITNIWIRK